MCECMSDEESDRETEIEIVSCFNQVSQCMNDEDRDIVIKTYSRGVFE